jgi:hypothetical protein
MLLPNLSALAVDPLPCQSSLQAALQPLQHAFYEQLPMLRLRLAPLSQLGLAGLPYAVLYRPSNLGFKVGLGNHSLGKAWSSQSETRVVVQFGPYPGVACHDLAVSGTSAFVVCQASTKTLLLYRITPDGYTVILRPLDFKTDSIRVEVSPRGQPFVLAIARDRSQLWTWAEGDWAMV